MAGPGFRPSSVASSHGGDRRRGYADHFGCRTEFGAPRARIVFPTAVLAARPANADPDTHDLVAQFIRGADRGPDFPEAVAIAIRGSLTGGAGLRAVAPAMLMHPRALQRRLALDGTTFDELTDQVRRQVVDDLLADPDLALVDVAHRLGYSEQSSLTRSCRRWFGQTPVARRRALT